MNKTTGWNANSGDVTLQLDDAHDDGLVEAEVS